MAKDNGKNFNKNISRKEKIITWQKIMVKILIKIISKIFLMEALSLKCTSLNTVFITDTMRHNKITF